MTLSLTPAPSDNSVTRDSQLIYAPPDANVTRDSHPTEERVSHHGDAASDQHTNSHPHWQIRTHHSPCSERLCSVGMVFLPDDDDAEATCRGVTEECLTAEGFELLGWRDVPVDPSVVGRFAKATEPRIAQVRPPCAATRRWSIPAVGPPALHSVASLVDLGQGPSIGHAATLPPPHRRSISDTGRALRACAAPSLLWACGRFVTRYIATRVAPARLACCRHAASTLDHALPSR